MASCRSMMLVAGSLLMPGSSVAAWKIGPIGSSEQSELPSMLPSLLPELIRGLAEADIAPLPQAADSPNPSSELPTFDFGGSAAVPSPEEGVLPSKPLEPPIPAPSITRAPYDGLEYRWNNLRIRPAELKLEGGLLLGLLVLVLLTLAGRRTNRARATAFWKAHLPLLHREFAQVGTDAPDALTADGAQEFIGYATGRRGSSGVTIRFNLRPRQDPIMWVIDEAWQLLYATGAPKTDWVELEWKLLPPSAALATAAAATGAGAFDARDAWVFAIVDKRGMNETRKSRWDLRTFTELKESQLLPGRFVLMSESGDITDALLRSKDTGLADVLASKPALTYLESLTISGTRQDEPEESELPLPAAPKSRTITLRLRLPPASESASVGPLLTLCHSLIDALPSLAIPSVSASKIPKRRAEVSEALLAETKKEQADAKEEAKRKKLKSQWDEKKKAMSPAQQEKLAALERKRQQTKNQNKTVKRK